VTLTECFPANSSFNNGVSANVITGEEIFNDSNDNLIESNDEIIKNFAARNEKEKDGIKGVSLGLTQAF
jgi:hypothetical protein